MKRISIFIAGVLFLLVGNAMATFPVTKEALVSADGNGVIVVRADSCEKDWVLIQFCQDNMRPGCGNNQIIYAFEDSGGVMKFRLDEGGIKSGQVAFNFRNASLNGKPWLHIPDCRISLTGNLEMGMSYKDSTIPESGGAHFVYTGSGIHAWSPVDMSGCGEAARRAEVVKKYVPAPTKRPVVSTGGVGGNQGMSVVKSPDSQNLQVQPNIGPVKIKGNNNKVTNTQSTIVTNNKGATVNIGGKVGTKEIKNPDGTTMSIPGVNAPTIIINNPSIFGGRSKDKPGDTVEYDPGAGGKITVTSEKGGYDAGASSTNIKLSTPKGKEETPANEK